MLPTVGFSPYQQLPAAQLRYLLPHTTSVYELSIHCCFSNAVHQRCAPPKQGAVFHRVSKFVPQHNFTSQQSRTAQLQHPQPHTAFVIELSLCCCFSKAIRQRDAPSQQGTVLDCVSQPLPQHNFTPQQPGTAQLQHPQPHTASVIEL